MTTTEGRDSFIGLPGDDAATSVFNLVAPATPTAAVTARTVDQIRAAIRYADSENLPVRVHATGHGAATARPMPPAAAQAHIDPVDPLPIFADRLLLDEMGDEGAAEFLRVAGPASGSVLTNAELRQLGGALSAAPPDGGALGQLDARFAYVGSGVPFGPVSPEAIMERCAVVRSALGRWDTGRTAPTFVGVSNSPKGTSADLRYRPSTECGRGWTRPAGSAPI